MTMDPKAMTHQFIETRNTMREKEDYSPSRVTKERQYSDSPTSPRKATHELKRSENLLDIRTVDYSIIYLGIFGFNVNNTHIPVQRSCVLCNLQNFSVYKPSREDLS